MWFLIKSIVGTGVLLLLAYGVFFINLGDKTFAGHFADVWESPTIQEKVDLVRDGVRNELEDRLAAVAAEQTRKVVRETLDGRDGERDDARDDRRHSERTGGLGNKGEEIADADRESLAKLIITD